MNNLDLPAVIILGGPGGSGRSTLAKQLTELTGYRRIYAGGIIRQIALNKGFGELDPKTQKLKPSDKELLRFHQEYQPQHPEIDLEIDTQLFQEARQSEVIIESMSFGPLTHRLNLPYLRVWVTADRKTRAQRVFQREQEKGNKCNLAEIEKINQEREKSNQDRFQKVFGFDFLDTDQYYDWIFDTTDLVKEEMGVRFLRQMQEKN